MNHYGLNNCPKCGSDNIKPQTPVEDDKMVRRIYARCFDCGHACKQKTLDKPIDWMETGKLPLKPIQDLWNAEC